jgi:ABC-2 type transport system ATP-binding protein
MDPIDAGTAPLDAVVRTGGLTKTYGPRIALAGIDLVVAKGTVYGLVGPNGAGKTTLLGILSGLRRPTAGTVDIRVPRSKVAVLADTPAFEPWLTAREVVDLARTLVAPETPGHRVDDVLAEAGLAPVTDVRVGGFSRGMLQRLGLAATVVGDPELLLLDEPSSALDPEGRRDVLDLVARLGRRASVLFSSHILDDVQRVCRDVGVLHEGRLLFQGPLDDLLTRRLSPTYMVRLRPPVEPALALLRAESWVREITDRGAGDLRVLVTSMEEAEHRLPAALARAGVRVIGFEPLTHDLESAFLELVR